MELFILPTKKRYGTFKKVSEKNQGGNHGAY